MTPERAAEIINARFRWQSDQETFGKRDHWAILRLRKGKVRKSRGDCDDYALTMAALLSLRDGERFHDGRDWRRAKRRAVTGLLTGRFRIAVWIKRKEGNLLGHVSLDLRGRHIDSIGQEWNGGELLASKGWHRIRYLTPLDVAVQIGKVARLRRMTER